MRKRIFILLTVAVLLVSSAAAVFAGGGQNTICNRGDRGNGTVAQNQINANCDWTE